MIKHIAMLVFFAVGTIVAFPPSYAIVPSKAYVKALTQ